MTKYTSTLEHIPNCERSVAFGVWSFLQASVCRPRGGFLMTPERRSAGAPRFSGEQSMY